MATNTYVALDTQTLSSTAASVTFSSISQSYTDLVLVVNAKATSGTQNNYLTIGNGTVDTGANYSRTKLSGDGTSATSSRNTGASGAYLDAYGDTNSAQFDSVQFAHIMNYSNTTTYKTILCRANRAGIGVDAIVNLWRSTDAINIITVNSSGTYAIGSTFTLYGISNAGDVGTKATGGVITQDATYTYHTFTMSGNFVPNQTLSCDYLVVAGGGGGGYSNGGGGGAGGIKTSTALSFPAATYQVLVGAGGAGGLVGVIGSNGQGSSVSSVTTTGGGGGGTAGTGTFTGATGGSGGGGAGFQTTTRAGGSGTSGEGLAGGSSFGSDSGGTFRAGGGGGGKGAVGTNASISSAGAGGSGLTSDYSGTSVNYGGGGGGGGLGVSTAGTASYGGGAGSLTIAGTAGTQGLGGGGGGGADSYNGGAGGSGIVIIRYAN